MPGHDDSMSKPRPAVVGVPQEFFIYECEHLALLGLVRNLSVQLRGHQEGILCMRVELEDSLEPGLHDVVLEISEWNADAGLIVECLKIQRHSLSKRNRIPAAQDVKDGERRWIGKILSFCLRSPLKSGHCDLNDQQHAQKRPREDRHSSCRAFS